ncbi:MAG: TetR/AcrR family transcriptional regulator [Bryobacteraceae bacterium]|nr:TetR/AcrR family transcriptional regulator [Bryobacteraceae bacterium]
MALEERRERYRESLRQDILDAARELFARQGYEATSVRSIAERVKCSPGILYHYFDDKPAIMAQLVEETFSKLTERLSAIRDDRAPAIESLRRAGRTYIEFGLDHPHHYAVLFAKPAPHSEDAVAIRAAYENHGHRCFDCLRTIVRRCMDDKCLRLELTDHEEVSQALWASIHGMVSIVTNAKGFPFIEQSRLIDRQLDILIEGVRKK